MSSAEVLKKHRLRRTEIREKVLDVFKSSSKALSNEDIEQHFSNLDRITLYRTLRTFEDRGIIHKIPHSGQSPLYAICQDNCDEHKHLDQHGHFHCIQCGDTLCMDDLQLPAIDLPEGYTKVQSHLMVEGKCPKCD